MTMSEVKPPSDGTDQTSKPNSATITVAIAATAVAFIACVLLCSGAAWFVGVEYGARSERDRIATERQKLLLDLEEAREQIRGNPAKPRKF